MEKVIIKSDYYETAEIVRDVFGISLNDYVISHDGAYGDGLSVNKPGVLMANIQQSHMTSIGPQDHVQCVDFAFEAYQGITVIGRYIYRRNKRGIEMLSGTTIITERDEKKSLTLMRPDK